MLNGEARGQRPEIEGEIEAQHPRLRQQALCQGELTLCIAGQKTLGQWPGGGGEVEYHPQHHPQQAHQHQPVEARAAPGPARAYQPILGQ